MRALLRSPRGGFTLIELMVAAAITLILLTAALAMVHRLGAYQRRQEWVEFTRRSTAQALGKLASDIRRAGLGCPTGRRMGASNDRFPPSILQATTNSLVLIADLPRPDSDFNGLSTLASDQGSLPPTGRRAVAIINEQSGPCVPHTFAPDACNTKDTSRLFRGDTNGCNGDPSMRTCPWALNRYQPGEQLFITNGMGRWMLTTVASPVPHTVYENRRALLIDNDVPPEFMHGSTPGFVSTPDRVSYRLEQVSNGSSTHLQLVRRQCWSWNPPIIQDPIDPARLDLLSQTCTAGSSTPDEVVLEFDMPPPAPHRLNRPWEDTLRFTYHTSDGTQLNLVRDATLQARLRNIRQVRVHVRGLRRPPASDASNQDYIEYNTQLTIDLRN